MFRLAILTLFLTPALLEAKTAYRQAKPVPFQKNNQSQCTSVDLRPQLPPVRNQAGVGWCYAFTVSDLVAFQKGKNISAFDVSLSYQQQKKDKSQNFSSTTGEGGYMQEAFTAAEQKGFCPENKNLSEDPFAFHSVDLEDIATIKIIDMLQELERLKKEPNPTQVCSQYGLVQNVFPELPLEEYIQAIFHSKTEFDFVDRLNKKACEGHRLKSGKTLVSAFRTKNNSQGHFLLPHIDAQLNKKNLVGIAWDPSAANSSYQEGDEIAKPSYDNGHASSIVARQWNPARGRCEYLVRNSWGNTCKQYSAYFKCDKNPGHLWVDEDFLSKTLLNEVYYLE